MTPVKLSEVKVGDVIWDLESNDFNLQTTFEVAKIEDGRVYLKYISGDRIYLIEDGNVMFSVFSNTLFYSHVRNL